MDIPVILGKDGKPVFIGQEDPHNPPVAPQQGSKMQCPVCSKEVDYLVGENANGGVQGCEGCWKPPTTPVQSTGDTYDRSKEIL